jgi:hypothetical protein
MAWFEIKNSLAVIASAAKQSIARLAETWIASAMTPE